MRLLCIALVLACVSTGQAATIEGRTINVADGDTITILDADRQQYKIRIGGIDAPEKGSHSTRAPGRIYQLSLPVRMCLPIATKRIATVVRCARCGCSLQIAYIASARWMSGMPMSCLDMRGGIGHTPKSKRLRIVAAMNPPKMVPVIVN